MDSASTTFQPLYYQVMLEIRGMIERNEIVPGDKLPSERELMNRYDVSRVTIRKALDELRALGVIEHRGKRGNYVSQLKGNQPVIESRSLFASTKVAGKEPSSTIISLQTTEASANQAKLFDIEPGSSLIEIQRLRNADNVPFAIEWIWLPGDLFGAINPWDLEHESFTRIIRDTYHIDIAYSTQSLEPIVPNKKDIELLKLTTKRPLLHIESSVHDKSGRLVKHSTLHFNTGMMSYSFTWRD